MRPSRPAPFRTCTASCRTRGGIGRPAARSPARTTTTSRRCNTPAEPIRAPAPRACCCRPWPTSCARSGPARAWRRSRSRREARSCSPATAAMPSPGWTRTTRSGRRPRRSRRSAWRASRPCWRQTPSMPISERRWSRRLPVERYASVDEGEGEAPPRGWSAAFPHVLHGNNDKAPGRDFRGQWARSPFADA